MLMKQESCVRIIADIRCLAFGWFIVTMACVFFTMFFYLAFLVFFPSVSGAKVSGIAKLRSSPEMHRAAPWAVGGGLAAVSILCVIFREGLHSIRFILVAPVSLPTRPRLVGGRWTRTAST